MSLEEGIIITKETVMFVVIGVLVIAVLCLVLVLIRKRKQELQLPQLSQPTPEPTELPPAETVPTYGIPDKDSTEWDYQKKVDSDITKAKELMEDINRKVETLTIEYEKLKMVYAKLTKIKEGFDYANTETANPGY